MAVVVVMVVVDCGVMFTGFFFFFFFLCGELCFRFFIYTDSSSAVPYSQCGMCTILEGNVRIVWTLT